MPAKNDKQRTLMMMALAMKKGKLKGKAAESEKVKSVAASMSKKQLTHFKTIEKESADLKSLLREFLSKVRVP